MEWISKLWEWIPNLCVRFCISVLLDSQSVWTDFALFSLISWRHHEFKQPRTAITQRFPPYSLWRTWWQCTAAAGQEASQTGARWTSEGSYRREIELTYLHTYTDKNTLFISIIYHIYIVQQRWTPTGGVIHFCWRRAVTYLQQQMLLNGIFLWDKMSNICCFQLLECNSLLLFLSFMIGKKDFLRFELMCWQVWLWESVNTKKKPSSVFNKCHCNVVIMLFCGGKSYQIKITVPNRVF